MFYSWSQVGTGDTFTEIDHAEPHFQVSSTTSIPFSTQFSTQFYQKDSDEVSMTCHGTFGSIRLDILVFDKLENFLCRCL